MAWPITGAVVVFPSSVLIVIVFASASTETTSAVTSWFFALWS